MGMRNDGSPPVQGRDRGGFLPTSFRAFSTYLRSVSANAGNIASSVRSAGVVGAVGVNGADDDRRREQVQWAGFDTLDLGPFSQRRVLLLTYANGFQVWDVHEASNVRELVSRRDGPMSCLRLLPSPLSPEPADSPLKGARPLLAVAAVDSGEAGLDGDYNGGHGGYSSPAGYQPGFGNSPGGISSAPVATVVRFYSLQSHSYVHVLRFRTAVVAVRCSSRLVAVALANQVYCFDAATLSNTFSVLTYPCLQPAPGTTNTPHGAMALGPRWLAYAANQPLLTCTGRASPQQMTPSPGASPSTSPANGGSAALVAHYAKESSKHLAAGIVTLGDMGYKTVSRYWSDLVLDGTSPQGGGGMSPKGGGGSGGASPRLGNAGAEPEYGGMVIVRDVVSRAVVAQFRAHSSPLSALAFDPSGTLLVTASVCGHNLNVFRLVPNASSGPQGSGGDASSAHVHLYKLYRGMTNAVIQDITFSSDSRWIAVSSTRGTTHLYAISPFGGPVGPETHASSPSNGAPLTAVSPAISLPWWSARQPLRMHLPGMSPPPPPVTLSVVSRIKNGNGGWAGGMTGVAAAATGRANTISGAVAAAFHNGGESEGEGNSSGSLAGQLWVLSPAGYLIRYQLRPYAGGDAENQGLSIAGGNVGVGVGSEPGPAPQLRLGIDPLERWDVCRRSGWAEREEKINSLAAGQGVWGDPLHDESGPARATGIGGQRNGEGDMRDGMRGEELQRWFMSNAEVMQLHHGRPPAIWARPQVYFHVLLPPRLDKGLSDSSMTGSGSSASTGANQGVAAGMAHGGVGGSEMDIEEIPTRPIEVRRRDLVPLCDRFDGGGFGGNQAARDGLIEPLPGDQGLRVHTGRVGEDRLDGSGLGNERSIRRSTSSSSTGSEGGMFGNGGFAGGPGTATGGAMSGPGSAFTGMPGAGFSGVGNGAAPGNQYGASAPGNRHLGMNGGSQGSQGLQWQGVAAEQGPFLGPAQSGGQGYLAKPHYQTNGFVPNGLPQVGPPGGWSGGHLLGNGHSGASYQAPPQAGNRAYTDTGPMARCSPVGGPGYLDRSSPWRQVVGRQEGEQAGTSTAGGMGAGVGQGQAGGHPELSSQTAGRFGQGGPGPQGQLAPLGGMEMSGGEDGGFDDHHSSESAEVSDGSTPVSSFESTPTLLTHPQQARSRSAAGGIVRPHTPPQSMPPPPSNGGSPDSPESEESPAVSPALSGSPPMRIPKLMPTNHRRQTRMSSARVSPIPTYDEMGHEPSRSGRAPGGQEGEASRFLFGAMSGALENRAVEEGLFLLEGERQGEENGPSEGSREEAQGTTIGREGIGDDKPPLADTEKGSSKYPFFPFEAGAGECAGDSVAGPSAIDEGEEKPRIKVSTAGSSTGGSVGEDHGATQGTSREEFVTRVAAERAAKEGGLEGNVGSAGALAADNDAQLRNDDDNSLDGWEGGLFGPLDDE